MEQHLVDFATVGDDAHSWIKTVRMVQPESQDLADYARWLFAQSCEFIMGAAKEEQLPASQLPEFAFAGRSNVGKSSLLNALVSRRQLARTSKTPGRTQQINFFDLAGKLYLVDLPGYGYARASKKDVVSWTRLIHQYLRGRVPLKRVFVLIDSRMGLKKIDHSIFELLDQAAVPYQIVLTKQDKISPLQQQHLQVQVAQELKTHPAAFPKILSTSSLKNQGVACLRQTIAEMVWQQNPA